MGSTKRDMDRVGLFQEMKYTSISDPYKPSYKCKLSIKKILWNIWLNLQGVSLKKINIQLFLVSVGFNEAAYKGKQVLPGPVKDRATGLQDGYFTKPFPRVFEKEAYSDPIGERRRERMKEAKKNVTNKPFVTFHGEKKPLGAGSTFGCFTTKTDYFSPKAQDKKPKEHEKPNVKTNPPKKGTGYGYPAVSLDKYPEYKGDKYDSAQIMAKVNNFYEEL